MAAIGTARLRGGPRAAGAEAAEAGPAALGADKRMLPSSIANATASASATATAASATAAARVRTGPTLRTTAWIAAWLVLAAVRERPTTWPAPRP
jgi:hypothetical protein